MDHKNSKNQDAVSATTTTFNAFDRVDFVFFLSLRINGIVDEYVAVAAAVVFVKPSNDEQFNTLHPLWYNNCLE